MDDKGELFVDSDPVVHCLIAMVDIRGFSAFAQNENDPSAVANYVLAATEHILTRVKTCRLLVDTVIKPLGDGLLFILKLEGETQSVMASSADEMLRELVDVSDTFPAYLALKRPPGLSSLPTRLGIGVTFGPLVRVAVRSAKPAVTFEDYVGHSINLAARLQELARGGGVLVHDEVYEKLLKSDGTRSSNFMSLFSQHLEVSLRNIGSVESASVYTTASTEIPAEYLKSKADENKLDKFAQDALLGFRACYARNRPQGTQLMQVPETIRFILFRKDGSFFRETVQFTFGQRIVFSTEAAFGVDHITPGLSPVTDAIASGKPILVSYSVRYDGCEDSLDNEYWRQTKERFPEAPIDKLHGLGMHPASILAIPLTEVPAGPVSAVAVFDSLEVGVFNSDIEDEMTIRVGVLYEQLFGSGGDEGTRIVQF
jgi:class 3 adenylate cyclase